MNWGDFAGRKIDVNVISWVNSSKNIFKRSWKDIWKLYIHHKESCINLGLSLADTWQENHQKIGDMLILFLVGRLSGPFCYLLSCQVVGRDKQPTTKFLLCLSRPSLTSGELILFQLGKLGEKNLTFIPIRLLKLQHLFILFRLKLLKICVGSIFEWFN